MVDVDRERDTGGELVYNLVIGALYVVAVSVQVFFIVDEVTHGALSDDLRRRSQHALQRWHERRRIDRLVQTLNPWVQFEAHTILEDGTA